MSSVPSLPDGLSQNKSAGLWVAIRSIFCPANDSPVILLFFHQVIQFALQVLRLKTGFVQHGHRWLDIGTCDELPLEFIWCRIGSYLRYKDQYFHL